MESLEKYLVVHKTPKFAYNIRIEVKWYDKIIIKTAKFPVIEKERPWKI